MSDFLIIDENLRRAMRFFGEATGSGDIRALPGSIAIFSGLDYGVFNIAMLEGAVGASGPAASGLEARLSGLARYFKPRTLRWSLWLCEDLLDPPTRRNSRQLLSDFDLREISHPPGMIARELAPPIRSLPPIECRPVCDAATRNAFAELTSIAFDIPINVALAVYGPERAWRGDYRGVVGLAAGKPVSIVATVSSGETVGIYSLATLPSHRNQGYGEALLRAAVANVQSRTGSGAVVLQSTEVGHSLYQRMGFRDATKFTVYLAR